MIYSSENIIKCRAPGKLNATKIFKFEICSGERQKHRRPQNLPTNKAFEKNKKKLKPWLQDEVFFHSKPKAAKYS